MLNLSKSLKKFLSLGLAAVTAVSLFACDNGGNSGNSGNNTDPTENPSPDSGKSEVTVYEEVADTDYSLTFYWGPTYEQFTDAEVTRMKEAGFDTASVYNIPWGANPEEGLHFEDIYEVVKKLEKQGINASVNDGRISQLVQVDMTRDKMIKYVEMAAEGWKEQNVTNLTEIFLVDEPRAEYANTLKMLIKVVKNYFPECTTYINLLPSYAGPAMWGVDTYEEYIEIFARDVQPDYLCTDYYAFTSTGRRETYAECLETMRYYGEKYDIETRFIALVSQHVGYPNVTREEISWQANLSLLYGHKQLSWFTYGHPTDGYSNEMVDVNGNATQHYYDVQAVNKTTRVLGNAIYDTDTEIVYYSGTEVSGTQPYSAHGKLGEIKNGKDLLISFYKNGYFMVMSQYSDGTEASVLEADAVSELQWCNPETNRWESIESCPYVNGDTVTLTAGQAVLFR